MPNVLQSREPSYLAALDFDGDGFVIGADFNQLGWICPRGTDPLTPIPSPPKRGRGG
jgi:hypothetical protein